MCIVRTSRARQKKSADMRRIRMIQKIVLRGGGLHGGGEAIRRTRISFAGLTTLGISLAPGVHAQSLETQAATAKAAPTESTVINLINLLVKRGVLTQQN